MDKKLVTILVVEDDDALREAICDALAFADFQNPANRPRQRSSGRVAWPAQDRFSADRC